MGRVDVALGVRATDDGVAYSGDFVGFANYAISKRSANLDIHGVADLAGHPVLAWEGASHELGAAFTRMFGPDGSDRARYTEVAEQDDQVGRFWAADDAIIVIDGSIFRYFTKTLGHSMDSVVLHDVFAPATDLAAAFRDAAVRDAFDAGLAELCDNGRYATLLARYEVEVPDAVCGAAEVREAYARFGVALHAIFEGDAAPMEGLWSHADDVTFMGPQGGVLTGWPAIRDLWRQQASLKLNGHVDFSNLHVHAGPTLAVAGGEIIGELMVDGKPQPVSIRATSVFRKERGAWKMIGHHADLLPFLHR
jgi:ketosteroid isomerase-like protein